MKIIEIELANFGGLKIDKPVRLGGGLDLWVAPNQSGKTTLFTFLEWMLYGPGIKRGTRDSNALRRWMPWNGGQPIGSIVIQPELKGWPGELLVTSKFADSSIVLAEHNTQKTLSDRVVIGKNGEWNLGDQLLNLNRESFLHSICATQGNLLDPLQPGSLRRILTSDLGALVENPDLATVDRIQGALEAPLFMLNGSGQPKPLKLLKHDMVKEIDFLQLEQTKLEQQLTVFRDLLAYRDSVVNQLEQQERVIFGLERQIKQLEMARSYYLLKVSQQPIMTPVTDTELEQTYPGYKQITSELEREIDNLAGQLEAIERQLQTESAELARLEEQTRAEETRMAAHSGQAVRLESAKHLRDCAPAVESAYQEFQRAQQQVVQVEAQIPEKDQARYAELEKLYQPHQEHLAAILDWQKEELAINSRLAQFRERKAELQILSRTPLPWTCYLGFGLAALSVLMIFWWSPMMGPLKFLGFCIGFLLLTAGAIFTTPVWKRRSTTGPAAVELKQTILPGIEEGQAALGVQDRKRRRFIELYSIDRNTWDKLVENIMDYGQLDMQMREYTSAVRDRDTISRRLNVAWSEISAILPLAPLQVDMDWLSQQVKEHSRETSETTSFGELQVRLEAQRQDVQRLAEERNRYYALVQAKLQPVGLQVESSDGLRQALGVFRKLADMMRQRQMIEQRQTYVDQSAVGLFVSGDDFDQHWAALSDAEQARLAALAGTRQGFDTVNGRLREASIARQDAESQRERLRKTLDNLRDELTKYGRIDREAEDLSQRTSEAWHKQNLVERWDKALRVASSIIGSLVTRATQDAAPEVDRALKQVLAAAPIKGIRDVRIGPSLELYLTVDNASSEIPPTELWTYLSSGAQQQLALALRLAMARTASGRTNLPLLLDEPLTELDDERAQLVFKYIAQVARTTQVVITTCHEKLYTWLAEGVQHSKLELSNRS